MARWSVQWDSNGDDGPRWLTVVRLAVALLIAVAVVTAVAAMIAVAIARH